MNVDAALRSVLETPDQADRRNAVRPAPGRHTVGFYETDGFLADAVVDLLAPGLATGEGALIIATGAHRERFEAALSDVGIDVIEARRSGQLVMLDARETQRALMPQGVLAHRRFRSVIGSWLDRVAEGGRPVRVFGEMVALLWDDGDTSTALALEDLWNELALRRPFVLLCGYPMHSFVDDESTQAFWTVCRRHSAVTNESYARLGSSDDGEPGVVTIEREWPGPEVQDHVG